MSVWHEQWMDLADDFRCVLMDHRSHGASGEAVHGDLSIRAMGRDVAAVLDALPPDRPVVVIGHSMGAMAIIAMAEQRPELFGPRVAGVALIGASSSDLFRGAMGSVAGLLRLRLGTFATAARRVDLLRRAVLASPADVGGVFARMTQFGPEAPPHLVDHVVGLAERARPEVWTDGLAELMDMDLRHALPRVRVPAIVIVGQHDRVTPPATAVELVGGLPDATLVVVEHAGHMAMLERPVEVNHDIRVFARRCLAGGGANANGRKAQKRAPKPTPRGDGVITDIEGVRVGHWTDPVGLTGCTVILCPDGSVACGRRAGRGARHAGDGRAAARDADPGRERDPADGRKRVRPLGGDRGPAMAGGARHRMGDRCHPGADRGRRRAVRPGGG